ncbi:hypothetical protein [Streptomyces sp. NBC_00887]|uniref:hypothetical protein n=1 Tax=Streptomyces sp. NBC_00887 TaxID=2975859 RepID=UPI0038649699|nr:hypothetical protein OG844_01335 [Streptomyces sp. NBC_00887]WSY36194.1 hypothetical protein OG844_44260 [Streptomyces sp. NBC_00887]
MTESAESRKDSTLPGQRGPSPGSSDGAPEDQQPCHEDPQDEERDAPELPLEARELIARLAGQGKFRRKIGRMVGERFQDDVFQEALLGLVIQVGRTVERDRPADGSADAPSPAAVPETRQEGDLLVQAPDLLASESEEVDPPSVDGSVRDWSAYFMTICKNKANQKLKEMSRSIEVYASDPAAHPSSGNLLVELASDPDSGSRALTVLREVLTPYQFQVYVRRHWYDMDLKAIANDLGKSYAGIRRALTDANKKLRDPRVQARFDYKPRNKKNR